MRTGLLLRACLLIGSISGCAGQQEINTDAAVLYCLGFCVYVDAVQQSDTSGDIDYAGQAAGGLFRKRADNNCDGVLDQSCPGLEYDICKDGGIVDAYMKAAFTGQCVKEPEPEICDQNRLVVSPSICIPGE